MNLDPAHSTFVYDIFVRDNGASGFTQFCSPGTGGVMPCPCGTPPGSSAQGCENSAATGGATLTATGAAYLSADTLTFTAGGECPTATSILLQGDAQISAGTDFGQGVRCVGGGLYRLYTSSASAGTLTLPSIPAGDPPITVRSSLLGDPIAPGQSRYYLVYYRDSTVLGGCPAISTFNATVSGAISWQN